MEKLPVFVYGTLMEGFHNFDRILKHETRSIKPATLVNHDMYSVNGGYPAIVPGEGTVVGQLIQLNRLMYDTTMERMDMLEGYYENDHQRSLYLREKKLVILEDGEAIEAYVYIWNKVIPFVKVTSGSWAEFVSNGYRNLKPVLHRAEMHKMVDALQNLQEAMQQVNKAWEQFDLDAELPQHADLFPFDMSLSDQTAEVEEWVNFVVENLQD